MVENTISSNDQVVIKHGGCHEWKHILTPRCTVILQPYQKKRKKKQSNGIHKSLLQH